MNGEALFILGGVRMQSQYDQQPKCFKKESKARLFFASSGLADIELYDFPY